MKWTCEQCGAINPAGGGSCHACNSAPTLTTLKGFSFTEDELTPDFEWERRAKKAESRVAALEAERDGLKSELGRWKMVQPKNLEDYLDLMKERDDALAKVRDLAESRFKAHEANAEASDELLRLRAQLDSLIKDGNDIRAGEVAQLTQALEDLRAERDKLKADNERLREKKFKSAEVNAEALEEILRLRAALEKIACFNDTAKHLDEPVSATIARDALR